ncbi:MAG: hypothetical protein NTW75_14365 [Planctomycetales bacterium]|nr:hypothetical protein [Planctomycetales bacterium]
MSSLMVVCPHCVTWVKTPVERCSECGVAINSAAPDQDLVTFAFRLGQPLLELGPVRLNRNGWPNIGQLIATTEGLVFLPDFISRTNGAMVTRFEYKPKWREWLHYFLGGTQQTPAVQMSPPEIIVGRNQPLAQRLFDSPGAVFVNRIGISRMILRLNQLQIQRHSACRITFFSVRHGNSLQHVQERLRELEEWRCF